ncbi:diguanylate cyclase [Desulfocurvus sp. DL9XJH121]
MGNSWEARLLSSVRQGLEQAFPPVMAQLLRELVKPAPDFTDIAQVIGMDPIMSAAVLNLVNSPFYGLTQRVTSLERAAVVLGTKEILKIALSVSYLRQDTTDKGDENSFATWRTIVWAAIAAELIAERICPDQADLAYLCTLLKDLSLLLLTRTEPDALAPLNPEQLICLQPGQLNAEAEAWGRTHPELTLLALEQWDIPDLGCGCIAHHHAMAELENHPALTQAVILATHWSELTGGCDRDPLLYMQFDHTLRGRLGIGPEEVEELRQTCVQKFRSLLAILNLDEAAPNQRLYEHSVQTMQQYHFQCLDIPSTSGGLAAVARAVARHLGWNFELSGWELSLRSPLNGTWALFRSTGGPVEEKGSAEVDTDLPWRLKKLRLLLLASGDKWGELRLPSGLSDQQASQVAMYVRFLSRAFEEYSLRQAVMESKARTLDLLPVGVARLDGEGRIQELNASLFRMLGAPAAPKGRDAMQCLHVDAGSGTDAEWRLFLADTEKPAFNKIACLTPGPEEPGQCLFVSAHKESAPGDDSILFLAEDLSDVTELEMQAFRHSEFLERLVDSMRDLVLTVDAKGNITFVSPSHRDRLQDANLFEVSRPTKDAARSWGPDMLGSTDAPLEISILGPDGSHKPMECIISPLHGRRSEPPAFLVVGRDLSVVRRLEEKVRRQAVYDGLTNLLNHHQFHMLLERETRRALRTTRPVGLIFFDLDKFKEVNDTQGHQMGDAVLRKVAAALREQVRQGTDFPCRYGGDEFAVIATEVDPGGLGSLASRIKAAVDSSLLGKVRLSMGVAMLKQGESPESLLKRADNACYQAKTGGGDDIVHSF